MGLPTHDPSPLGDEAATENERDLREHPEYAAAWVAAQVGRDVAEALIGYRMRHDLTQDELGARLGMTDSVVARLERGDHTPSVKTIAVIATTLGVAITIGGRERVAADRGGRARSVAGATRVRR